MEHRQELLARINQTGRKLSKGQKRIAEFIVNHYDKAAFMTASRLGEKVQVSESTVVRFAIALGYDGYPALQKALQKLIDDGTYMKILKYWGVQDGAISKPEINTPGTNE